MNIIFDYNRTLFDPETDSLYQGVLELLEQLAEGHRLFLISRNEPGREGRLDEFGIRNFFLNLAFVEEKNAELFDRLIKASEADKIDKAGKAGEIAGSSETAIVIGDRIQDEIRIGNQMGFMTVWIQQGKFGSELPTTESEQPDHIVQNIQELRTLLQNVLGNND